jgi:DNA-binding MarR family transcriptional regulator
MTDSHLEEQDYLNAAELRLALRTFLAGSELTLRKHGMTPQRYELLLFVKVSEPSEATVTQLAAKLRIGQSATTQLVRRAENDGMLERQLAPDDARVHHLSLTRQGAQRLAAALTELGPPRRQLIDALASLPPSAAASAASMGSRSTSRACRARNSHNWS